MARKAKTVYPELERWMADSGTDAGKMMTMLHLSAIPYRNRMRGVTPWTALEKEKLEQAAGIPWQMLLIRKEVE